MINCLIGNQHLKNSTPHCFSLEKLTSKQWLKVKSFIVVANNHLNGILPSFDSLHKKLSSGFQLLDNFHDHFSFHIVNHKNKDIKDTYLCKLNKVFEDSLTDSKTVIIISDTSIKNNVAMSISHICSDYNILAKTIYYAVNVT